MALKLFARYYNVLHFLNTILQSITVIELVLLYSLPTDFIILHTSVGRVILMEKSELEAERVALFESVIKNQRSMKELESNLLHRLTSSEVTLILHFCMLL